LVPAASTFGPSKRAFGNKRALALDPRSIEAQIGLALMLVSRVFDFWSDAPDVDLLHAAQLIEELLAARGIIARRQ
jgi:hypothetical protein